MAAAIRAAAGASRGSKRPNGPIHSFNVANYESSQQLSFDAGELKGSPDRKKEEAAVHDIWEEIDVTEKGGLDDNEFSEALKRMDMGIPNPLIKALFKQIDINDQGIIQYREFLSFINSKNLIFFDEEYNLEFSKRPFDLILERDPETGKIIVAGFNAEYLKDHLLPSSELTKIGESYLVDILEHAESYTDMAPALDFLQNVDLPVTLTFRKQVLQENMALLNEDKDWDLLSKDMSTLRLEKRMKKLTEPTVFQHCKFCPQKDTNNKKPNLSCLEVIHLLCEDENYNWGSFLIISVVMLLIFVSTFSYVLETEPRLRGNDAFVTIEYIVSSVFTLEYAARIVSCRNMWLYFWAPMNMIDFLAVIPFWIELSLAGGGFSGFLRVIRVIRLARIVRLLKSPFFTDYLDVFAETIRLSSHAFGLILTMLCLFIVVFGSLVYEMENIEKGEDGLWYSGDAQTYFISIPAAMYWCVVTMTTVGYGDYSPTQVPAQAVGIVTMLVGLLVIALPVIIIGGNFDVVYTRFRKRHDREARNRELELDSRINSVPYKRVEDFFKQINEHINTACQAEELEFFTEQDISAFIEEGFDTQEKVIALLKAGDIGLHFFPVSVQAYKRYVFYKVFGKEYRGAKQNDPFIRLRNELYRKTAKCS